MSWKLVKYNNDTDALFQSDIEELRKEPAPVSADDGQLKALILDFCLPSSSYATMALREILKEDTSAAHQVKLQQSESAKRTHESENNESKSNESEENDSKKAKLDDGNST